MANWKLGQETQKQRELRQQVAQALDKMTIRTKLDAFMLVAFSLLLDDVEEVDPAWRPAMHTFTAAYRFETQKREGKLPTPEPVQWTRERLDNLRAITTDMLACLEVQVEAVEANTCS